MINFKLKINEILTSFLIENYKFENQLDIKELLTKPEKDNFGDLSLPCFRFSPILRKSPNEIADIFKKQFENIDFISNVENVNGYLNFHFNPKYLYKEILNNYKSKKNEAFSVSTLKGKTILVEFSSPNIAKPFSIGHLRSTVIGNFLSNLFRFAGANVSSINHIGDWGTQFGKLIVAFKKWGNVEELKNNPVTYLLNLYVKFHSESEKNPNLEDEARLAFKNLEEKKSEETKLWNLFKDYSFTEFEKTYSRLNVKFDFTQGESFYSDKIQSTIQLLENKKLLKESENATIVDLEKYNMPPCLIKKSDGATLYATRDLAAAIYRFETFNFDNLFYVVGGEQSLHFKQFFKVLELAEQNYYKNMEHVSFGLYRFKDGKMSTRKGKVVLLNDVLNEAVSRVMEIIKTKNPNLTEQEKINISETLGTSAVIFNDLKNDRIKDVSFSWDEVLNMEGDSGPYISYSFVRCLSILRKINKEIDFDITNIQIKDESESLLIRKLYEFSDIIDSCIKTRKSHHLTTYLLDLTKKFHSFYHNCRVLGEDEETTNFRLSLVKITSIALKSGCEILGMRLPEKM